MARRWPALVAGAAVRYLPDAIRHPYTSRWQRARSMLVQGQRTSGHHAGGTAEPTRVCPMHTGIEHIQGCCVRHDLMQPPGPSKPRGRAKNEPRHESEAARKEDWGQEMSKTKPP
jgi:hypothetical protein